jgi:actin related protein 2/3 complex subunit 3
MPAYHSSFNDESNKTIAGMAILPLRTQFKGPAPRAVSDGPDIIDEAIQYFKANVFFKSYEVKGSGDRVLIYLTLYIQECLKKVQRVQTKHDGASQLQTLAVSNFDIPGDPKFPLNPFYEKPGGRADADTLRNYMLQLRQEVGQRLAERVYTAEGPSKVRISLCV